MVGHGVIARFRSRHGADAGAREAGIGKQILRNPAGVLLLGDSGEQTLAGVRGSHATGLLVAVQGEGVSRNRLTPESIFESLLQGGGLVEKLLGQMLLS